MKTVICMKWGTRYGPHYVNRLHGGVTRHLSPPFRFVCFTDDATGLAPGVEARPLPPIPLPARVASTPWRKLSLWQAPLDDLEGDALFLDLDLLAVGDLDPFFAHAPGRYCVIENFTQGGRGIGNTSAFLFPVGGYPEIYERFAADPEAVLADNRIEQQYISRYIREQTFWPKGWCVSFKHDLAPRFPMNWLRAPALPPQARIVVFSGRPDIDEARDGRWPAPLHKRFYKHARPAPWIADHWREADPGLAEGAGGG